jgi:hypothetical protein
MDPAKFVTAAEMDRLTPQERADVVDAGIARSWEDVPEPFKARVLATARKVGAKRTKRG